MRTPHACRVEFHGDGQSHLLGLAGNLTEAPVLRGRHAAALSEAGALGRLVLLDEANGQVLARRQVRPCRRPIARGSVPRPLG